MTEKLSERGVFRSLDGFTTQICIRALLSDKGTQSTVYHATTKASEQIPDANIAVKHYSKVRPSLHKVADIYEQLVAAKIPTHAYLHAGHIDGEPVLIMPDLTNQYQVLTSNNLEQLFLAQYAPAGLMGTLRSLDIASTYQDTLSLARQISALDLMADWDSYFILHHRESREQQVIVADLEKIFDGTIFYPETPWVIGTKNVKSVENMLRRIRELL